MSAYVIAAPDALATASADLTGIGTVIKEATAAAVPSTTGIAAAAGDEVSAAIARFFGGYAREFQTLSARTTQLQTQFERALSEAGSAYATAEAANMSPLRGLLEQPLRGLLEQAESLGFFSPFERSIGHQLFASGNAGGGAGSIPAPTGGTVVNTASSVLSAPATNTVTGVRVGFSFLPITLPPQSFLGIPIPSITYPAPTLWYFPTQADGTVHANGVVYLQHGFGAIGWFYQPLAMQLAQQTNSVVVVPTIPSIPLPLGLWLNSPQMQQGVASLFLGNQTALNISASQAGYQGVLPQDFILSGHSAGGGLATIAAGDYLADLGGNIASSHLRGVVMFDGVANDAGAFGAAVASLKAAQVPVYVVAAPPQPWNAFGATTNQLVSMNPGQFVGVTLVNGSHVDSMLGGNPVVDFAAQLLTGFSPPGNTAAVYTLASGWINDIYAGASPENPIYGVYGTFRNYVPPGGQQIILGQATGIVLP
ncbi:PE domain-containing protein [Mycobacterium vicinigordonae]|uniref:PE family protein n=1 Tax=Mycobacterium vicinigordonae TaxID=1719132 RepID=A0A7D6I3Y7_9MYCO|nr:PE family protein [Mycobacterium vicinigordonae]QLL05276.1 PE family protein [Mycobacterium vicinigordonae]